MRRPAAEAMRGCAESAAGIDDAPGSVSPSASTAAAIVEAVPIVMHVPNERAMPSSISRHVHSSSVPARRSAQYFQTSVPEPSDLAAPVAAEHRPGRHEDRRQVRARRAHDQRRHGLVAAAEQHDAVGRIRAQRFLRLHRQQVAIEHRASAS